MIAAPRHIPNRIFAVVKRSINKYIPADRIPINRICTLGKSNILIHQTSDFTRERREEAIQMEPSK
jgi:hypothetical protein